MDFPSAEAVVVELFRAQGWRCYVTPPRDVKAPYLRVARVGGVMRDLVTDAAMLAVSAYAVDPASAEKLANQARSLLFNRRFSWVGAVWLRGWQEAAGPSNYPDPNSKMFRYQFSGQLFLATNLG